MKRVGVGLALVLGHLSATSSGAATAPAPAPGPVVTAIPAPGTSAASPDTAVTLRWADGPGADVVAVVGEHSGPVEGHEERHPDGRGVTFHPSEPFVPGERVEVSASAPIRGADGSSMSFTVARPAPHPGPSLDGGVAPAEVGTAAAPVFITRPDLRPPEVDVRLDTGAQAPGFLFATPSGQAATGVSSGVMIYDDAGELVWFRPQVEAGITVGDAHVADYLGQPALVWFEGTAPFGAGSYRGEFVAVDSRYQELARIRMGNGYQADLHDIWLTPQGTAWMMAYNPVTCSGVPPLVGCRAGATILEAVVQEVDLRTGVVLWEWHSLDHVPLSDTYLDLDGARVDYIHPNSLHVDEDGDVLMSARNTSALYKIDYATGEIEFTFGGKSTSFPNVVGEPEEIEGPDFPHHFVGRGNDRYSYFDNSSRRQGPSRGAIVHLDTASGTATYETILIREPSIFANTQGSMQALAGGNELIAWGGTGVATEYDSAGNAVFEAALVGSGTYRQLRHEWTGTPAEPPTVSRTGSGDLAVSWNGDTRTEQWRLLGGDRPDALAPIGTVGRTGFETVIEVPPGAGAWLAVEALDGGAAVIGRSAAVAGSQWFDEVAFPNLAPTAPIVGDFAGSRADDVISYRPGAAADTIHVSDGVGGVQSATLPPIGHTYTPIVGDFIGDDRDEVLWWRPGVPTAYLWRFDLALRSTVPPVTASSPVTVPVTKTTPLVLDHRPMYGGGSDELLWYTPGSGPDRLDRFSWPASGSAQRHSRALTVTGKYQPVVGDFDGNGLADVFWYAPGAARDSIWFHVGSAGGSTGYVTMTMHVNGVYEVVTGDFSGTEARDEIYFHAAGSRQDYLWRFENGRTYRSVTMTNATGGRALTLSGSRDRVLFWGAGEPMIGRFDGDRPVIEPSGNSTVPAGYSPSVGGFVGVGGESSVLWHSTTAPELLWAKR